MHSSLNPSSSQVKSPESVADNTYSRAEIESIKRTQNDPLYQKPTNKKINQTHIDFLHSIETNNIEKIKKSYLDASSRMTMLDMIVISAVAKSRVHVQSSPEIRSAQDVPNPLADHFEWFDKLSSASPGGWDKHLPSSKKAKKEPFASSFTKFLNNFQNDGAFERLHFLQGLRLNSLYQWATDAQPIRDVLQPIYEKEQEKQRILKNSSFIRFSKKYKGSQPSN